MHNWHKVIFMLIFYGGLIWTYAFEASNQLAQEDQLLVNLFRDYNSLVKPDPINGTRNLVKFGMALILLINVEWTDQQLRWNPRLYDGITIVRVPHDKVWQPDIVLFNNADGNYEVSFPSNTLVHFSGQVVWVPPAIYKSSCKIDVQYFPFDEQTCPMYFGSWTYDRNELAFGWYNGKDYVELHDYASSGIWDLMSVGGKLQGKDSRIVFYISIRRKTLFYTVILIIPTVLMAFLSMMVFYLPADASEKITLAISILLALVVFLLLVSKILPPTSDNIPLMAKYLLLTFVLNIVTILVTVIIINVYFRSPTTHKMTPWVRKVFLQLLPRLLAMQRPRSRFNLEDWIAKLAFSPQNYFLVAEAAADCYVRTPDEIDNIRAGAKQSVVECQSLADLARASYSLSIVSGHHPNCKYIRAKKHQVFLKSPRNQADESDGTGWRLAPGNLERWQIPIRSTVDYVEMSPDMQRTIDAIDVIVDHLRENDETTEVEEDWKYVAMVIDRLLLYIFFGITIGGTLGILLSAPNVFKYIDQEAHINRLMYLMQQHGGTVTIDV